MTTTIAIRKNFRLRPDRLSRPRSKFSRVLSAPIPIYPTSERNARQSESRLPVDGWSSYLAETCMSARLQRPAQRRVIFTRQYNLSAIAHTIAVATMCPVRIPGDLSAVPAFVPRRTISHVSPPQVSGAFEVNPVANSWAGLRREILGTCVANYWEGLLSRSLLCGFLGDLTF